MTAPALDALDYVRAIYQLPLGFASFTLFAVLRRLVRTMGYRSYRKDPESFRCWRILSGDLLVQPHQLSRYMVMAPRWNPHAVAGSAGPVPVQRDVQIHLGKFAESVGYWSFVAYGFPSFVSAGYASSLTGGVTQGVISLQVPPGDYYIGCRYYGCPDNVEFPQVSTDGTTAIQAVTSDGNVNDFYESLSKRQSAFYSAIHYHAFVLLKFRGLFPAATVKRRFLPVGNEDTGYLFGVVKRGDELHFRFDMPLLADCWVFCTVYSRASLPVMMLDIVTPGQATAPAPCDGTYLVRIMRRSATGDGPDTAVAEGRISVTIAHAAARRQKQIPANA